MDAVSLALPVSNPAASGNLGSDPAALAAPGEQASPIGFAALLAAGIELQQRLDPALAAAAAATAQEGQRSDEASADAILPGADPNAALAAANALSITPPVMERAAHAGSHGAQGDAGPDARLTASALTRNGTDAAQTAADAARIAALPAEDADAVAATAQTRFQVDLGEEMQSLAGTADAARADASAQAAQALNLQPVEQRQPLQQPVAVREVAAPVGSSGFADALSQQVVWMVDKDAQVAELRINPPELGPVEVRLSVSGDQASAQFVSAHAEVREALESAIARLRESFAEAGIRLDQASVGAESFREQADAQADARALPAGYRDRAAADDMAPVPAAPQRIQRGLVDTFA